jgi:hypothetical protein
VTTLAAASPDWALFLQTPGLRYFDPDADDLRLFGVPPAADYEVPQTVGGAAVSGDLFGVFGTAAFRTQVLSVADADADADRWSMPLLAFNNGQRGSVMLTDRVADRTNVEPALLGKCDLIFPSPQVMSFDCGPVLDFQPVVNDDLTIGLRMTLGSRGIVGISPEAISVGGQPSRIRVYFAESPRVRTTVTVPDGGTVLLGGIQNSGDPSMTEGVPLLNNIPVLNKLFAPSNKSLDTRNLMLMITPRIVKEGAFKGQ